MATTMPRAPKKQSTSRSKSTRNVGADVVGAPTHDQIAQRARLLYERSGYASGRDEEFWLEAERQLRAQLETELES